MNSATTQRSGLLRFGSRDVDVMFRVLCDPRLGACDLRCSRQVINCSGYSRFHAAFVRGILKHWSPADQLIFYFSGHGLLHNDLFCLQLGPESTEVLPFDNLLNLLRQYSVHRSILILDACHSGAATVKDFDESQLSRQFQHIPPGAAIIASCEQWELSKEYEPERLSLFTCLLEQAIRTGMAEQPDREWLSIEDVLSRVEAGLKSPKLAHSIQTPRRKITDAGACLPFVKNVHFTGTGRNEAPPQQPTRFMEVCWSLPIIKTPLAESSVSSLRQKIHAIRRSAWDYLKGLRSRHKPPLRDVRASLYLPSIGPATGSGLVLCPQPGLQCGVKLIQEVNLQLAPGQGTTGVGFQSRQPVLTVERSRRHQDRKQLHTLTGAQLRRLHPKLRWTFSIPVSDQHSGEPLAVLNLDGLSHVFSEAELLPLLPHLETRLGDLSTSLAGLSRIHVHLGWSD